MVEPEDTDLCRLDPGFGVDILVTAQLRAMTSVWMGVTKMNDEIDQGAIQIDAAPALESSFKTWLKLSPFAAEPRMVS